VLSKAVDQPIVGDMVPRTIMVLRSAKRISSLLSTAVSDP